MRPDHSGAGALDPLTDQAQIESAKAEALTVPQLAALAAAVFVTVAGGLVLTAFTGRVAAIWVANAIVVAALMKTGRRAWPAILAVAVSANAAANIFYGDAPLTAVTLPLCNVLEILLVAAPLRALALDRDLLRLKPLLAFYALALGPATVLCSIVAGAYLHRAIGNPFAETAIAWYAADALGLGIFVPPLVAIRARDLTAMFDREHRAVSLALVALVVAATVLILAFRQYPLGFLFLPVVILLAFHRGYAGGAIGLLIAGSYFLSMILFQRAPVGLAGYPLREQVMIAQIFVAVLGLSVMLVAAALEERRRLEFGLAAAIARAELAREEAQFARVSAEEASRAKSMFLANMSHELRTPLNAVIGFAETMQIQAFGPLGSPKYAEYAGLISKAGAHLLDLINDILDMSRIEAGKLELHREAVDLSLLVRECAGLMQDSAKRGQLTLETRVPSAPWMLHADRRALKQILLNLLSNAVKFTPEGGRIEICLSGGEGDVALSVRDSGIGIPAEDLHRAGNPFVQFHPHAGKQGTGLGLALVRSLTQLHGGRMKIDSAAGQGTTVTITLPAAYPSRAAA